MLGTVLLSAAASFVLYTVWSILQRVTKPYFSALKNIPGPPSPSWLYGNIREILQQEAGVQVEQWVEQYGHVFKFKWAMNADRLVPVDTKALHHILTHSFDYQKPKDASRNIAQIFGYGLLAVEEEEHKQQRRIMNPAFGPMHLREMTSIFFEKAIQLRDIWLAQIPASGEPAMFDALSWLSRMTLDVIGQAGFGYDFNALNPDSTPNELNQAFATIFQGSQNRHRLFVLNQIPLTNLIPTERRRRIAEARRTMDRIGRRLLEEKKRAVRESTGAGGKVEKKAFQGRDLLSLLVKANMAEDIPENQRLTDDQVLAQVPTFMIAGHETSSTGATWCLYALSRAPDAQVKLREELRGVSTDTPSMDELNALPYLDAVIREMLRIHAPVPMTARVAMKDDVIPLSKPFVDRYGKTQDVIRISKGDSIAVPILQINCSKEIWGEDAGEFKPERWLKDSVPEAAHNVPGIWGNILTFLGGPRACIGYRFSLVEMKAIIFTLIRALEFSLAVPPEQIGKRQVIVTRPVDLADPEKKNWMPLLVRPVKQ
ncbi:cytochrome P450 [Gloeophyllum trabeum ATCC 11539]|uniref:Cytochrome P450 n=1 Tax=Gloeophyllum trabeum (strain ATCC 11539 / FP-39264 / Madison 617) TaxID=670483 RepID=S7PVR3_GLOTA|nr:cytochrome P450 [Gloeophyllum trabeum ATCC 11539]EPQ51721.1 cytochrome P450 [Gloeophyllum trabeum ATCC 11539]